MRFSKVGIIGTLMAAAVAMLVILPVLATDGFISTGVGTNEDPTFDVRVFNEIADAGGAIAGGESSLRIDGAASNPEDSKFGVLYISNATPAFDVALVTFLRDGQVNAAKDVEIDVSSGDSLTLALATTTVDGGYQAFFTVVPSEPTGPQVAAGHGDVITITSPFGQIFSMTVDARGPVIAGTSPAEGFITDDLSITFGAVITDANSGLRHDGEGNGDGDGDGTEAEPLAITGGASVDIDIYTKLDNDDDDGSTDRSGLAGAAGWSSETNGYSFSFTEAGYTSGNKYWYITATDRAGNETRTDADEDTDANENYKITIDDSNPRMKAAVTGTGFDEADEVTEDNPAAIEIEFENTAGGADKLDKNSVQATDFILSDGLVIDEVIVNDEFVYLILTADLAPDATPDIQMLAGVISDKAGNLNGTDDEEAVDKIKPTFTVTITGDASSRAVGETELTVRIDSDEELTTAPIIYFVDFKASTTDDDIIFVNGVENDTMSAVTGSDTAWQETYTAVEMGVDADGALVGVIVIGTDDATNEGKTDGWKGSGDTPQIGDLMDFVKMDSEDLLGEIDDKAPTKTETLLPGVGTETEATNPFIRLAFTEDKEYKIAVSDETTYVKGDDSVKVDAHGDVTITSITLDGDDVSGAVAQIDGDTFNVATAALSLGDHTLTYTVEDAVGNDATFDFDFEVIERSDYKVAMSPGWNLISLPGTPVDSDIDSVLPDSMKASRILQWVDGAFEVNERGGDGTWDPSGGVTEIVAGPGYWVFTTAFEDIEALIPLPDPANILPTVAVVGGWNLLGVIDLGQAKDGTGVGNPNGYMASIDFSVVYSYDTQANSWDRLANGGTCAAPDAPPALADCMSTGSGYWVWANKAGTLVP